MLLRMTTKASFITSLYLPPTAAGQAYRRPPSKPRPQRPPSGKAGAGRMAAGQAPCAGLPSPAPRTTAIGRPASAHMTASPAPAGGGAQAEGEGNTHTHGKQETRSRGAGGRNVPARERRERQGKTILFFSARRGRGGSMPPRTRTPQAPTAGQTPTLRRVPRHPARRRKAGRDPPATSGMQAGRDRDRPQTPPPTIPTYGGNEYGRPPRSGSRDGARREGASARPTDPDARGGGGGAGQAPNAGGTHAGGARVARGGGGMSPRPRPPATSTSDPTMTRVAIPQGRSVAEPAGLPNLLRYGRSLEG